MKIVTCSFLDDHGTQQAKSIEVLTKHAESNPVLRMYLCGTRLVSMPFLGGLAHLVEGHR